MNKNNNEILLQQLRHLEGKEQINSLIQQIRKKENDLQQSIEYKKVEVRQLLYKIETEKILFENQRTIDEMKSEKEKDMIKKKSLIQLNEVIDSCEKYYFDKMKQISKIFQDTQNKLRKAQNSTDGYYKEGLIREINKQNFNKC